ncbi:hypothetical protein ANO14919_129680 [Xylariales sp. No.14919]|nr:hypothetical protein ANO14919_129680 [Xylariales sp. No.14919]
MRTANPKSVEFGGGGTDTRTNRPVRILKGGFNGIMQHTSSRHEAQYGVRWTLLPNEGPLPLS